MQRKCNLSLYINKRLIARCLHCNVRLQDPRPNQLYCSDRCRDLSQERSDKEQAPRSGTKRRAEIHKSNDDCDLLIEDEIGDDALWLKQALHWKKEAGPHFSPRRLTKDSRVIQKPLILTGHGVKLRVERRSLLVQNGFAHYPQAREEWRFFPADPDLPSRIVLVDTNGYLTLDVFNWLSTNNVPLVLLNWKGDVSTVIGPGPADLQLRNAQLAAMVNGRGFRLAVALVRAKIKGSQRTLNSLPITPAVDAAINTLGIILNELNREIASLDALMLIEARAAAVYFQAWRETPIYWKGTNRHVIPPQWRSVGPRESFFSGRNRHATHPVNALLNYAYRMLESQVHIATIAAGLDPTIGFLHANREGRATLVYDLMEPLRPQVDRFLLLFVRSNIFTPADFLLGQKGICRLHPQLVRRVIPLMVPDGVVQRMVNRVIAHLSKVIIKDITHSSGPPCP